jgi:hypothetical protein
MAVRKRLLETGFAVLMIAGSSFVVWKGLAALA